ncbi:hemolysin III family protein [Kiritimatiellota bacterium B12222]|nr:hemolysin III family protein [Kiritimatiellota bacterium B12222]
MNALPPLSKDDSIHVTDERFNTVSHLFAFVFSLVGSAVLIIEAVKTKNPWLIVGVSLYALGLCSLFLFSTLHHGVNGSPRTERLLQTLDYLAIYLLIAGTFSPVCLGIGRTSLGWSVFGTIWVCAITGMVLKSSIRGFPKWLGLYLYVILGWVAVLLAGLVYKTLGIPAFALLAVGGLAYTIGGAIFIKEAPNPIPGRFGFHEIWHLFVIVGALCHYAFIWEIVKAL